MYIFTMQAHYLWQILVSDSLLCICLSLHLVLTFLKGWRCKSSWDVMPCHWVSSSRCSEEPWTTCCATQCQKTWVFNNIAVRTSDVESSKAVHASSLMLSHSYRIFLLSLHQAQQLYHTEILHVPGHLVTAALLRAVIKETHCTFRCDVILQLYSGQPTAFSRRECQMYHQYTDWWHIWFFSQLCRDLVILFSHLFWLFTWVTYM